MAMSAQRVSGNAAAAGQQIYSGAYNYAMGQGSTPQNATNFANTMLGVASGEGLYRSNPWAGNADVGGHSVGPFQLYSGPGGGLGSQFGITDQSSPQDQMNAAFSTAYNANGNFNLRPWNAVGDTIGTGPTGNNSALGRSTAQGIGANIAAVNGFGQNQIANGPDQTFTDNTGKTYTYTTDPNAPPSQFDTTGMVGGGSDITDGSAGGPGFTQAGAPTSSPTTSTGTPQAGSPTGTGATGGTQGQGQGTPVNLGLQGPTVQDIGGWVNNAISSTGKGLQAALTAAENAIATLFGGIANWFIRGLLVVVGLVLIVLALLAITGKSVVQMVEPKGA